LGNEIYICMQIAYKSKKLQKQLSIASETKKAFGTMAKNVAQRIQEMQDANNLAELQDIPQARCHALTGDRNGEWSVSVSGNYRIIFTLHHDEIPIKEDGSNSINTILITDIKIEEITDYH
jgi:plasmid maintenance system killer protein